MKLRHTKNTMPFFGPPGTNMVVSFNYAERCLPYHACGTRDRMRGKEVVGHRSARKLLNSDIIKKAQYSKAMPFRATSAYGLLILDSKRS